MNELFQPTARRTVLKRSLAFIAGALGLQMAAPAAPVAPTVPSAPSPPTEPLPPAPGGGATLRFYTRRLQVHAGSVKPGQLPVWNGRLNSRGDLLERPDGAKVGEFSATCFSPDSPFGCAGSDHAVELQTLKVANGTLFGIGSAGPLADGERAHAILGGTGRFAGVRGSYVIRQNRTGRGEESVEFLITLLT